MFATEGVLTMSTRQFSLAMGTRAAAGSAGLAGGWAGARGGGVAAAAATRVDLVRCG
jgi:hypothetical protein